MPLSDFLKKFRSSAETIKNELAEAERALELARRRREELLILPPTKSEVVKILCDWVHLEAKKYPTTLRSNLNRLLRERSPLTGAPANGHSAYVPDILTIGETGKIPSSAHLQSTLTFFLEDVLCSGIERAVKDLPDWNAGPAQAERVAELEKVDRTIAELEQKLREMVASVAETATTFASVKLSPTKREPVSLDRWSDDERKTK